jgi:hypothetical protein
MERVRGTVIAGLAALALAGGALAAAGPAASAATTACGTNCVALASQALGTGDVSAVYYPRFGRPGTGQNVILSGAGAFSTEDWQLTAEGTVAQFYALGIVGPAVGQTWPSYEAYEYRYMPNGINSNTCLGTSTTAGNGTDIVLQTCGINAQTLWIPLTPDLSGGFEPFVNGTDTVVNTPYVLTAGPVGTSLTTSELGTVAGSFNRSQMWENVFGVL